MYIIIGFAIILVIIVLRYIASKKRTITIEEPKEEPEPQYQTVDLYEVKIHSKNGMETLNDVIKITKSDGFLVFTLKDYEKSFFKKDIVVTYNVKKTGSYERELNYRYVYSTDGTSIEYF